MRRHKQNTCTFRELDFPGQAKSISGTIRHLERACPAHWDNAQNPRQAWDKCIAQIERLATRLRARKP
jgi:hypothetical protein